MVSVRIRSATVSMSNGAGSPRRTLAVETSVPSRRLRPSMLSNVVAAVADAERRLVPTGGQRPFGEERTEAVARSHDGPERGIQAIGEPARRRGDGNGRQFEGEEPGEDVAGLDRSLLVTDEISRRDRAVGQEERQHVRDRLLSRRRYCRAAQQQGRPASSSARGRGGRAGASMRVSRLRLLPDGERASGNRHCAGPVLLVLVLLDAERDGAVAVAARTGRHRDPLVVAPRRPAQPAPTATLTVPVPPAPARRRSSE